MHILVLLPERRRWNWHGRLVARLRESHEVAVRRVPSPPLPRLLRAQLRMEARRHGVAAPFGGRATEETSAADAPPDLVLDLSERCEAAEGAAVLKPLYDGSADTRALAGRLLRGECPLLDIVEAEKLVASSYAAVENRQALGAGLAQAFARVEALLLRACARRGRPPSPLPPRPARAAAPFTSALLLGALARRAARKTRSLAARPALRSNHWNLALRWRGGPADLSGFELADYAPLAPDPSSFYADPFVIEEEGRHFLFAEAYPYATSRGVIVCAEVERGGGLATPFRTVLERPYHLSYPFIFRRDGGLFLVPETLEHGGVEIYRAKSFPDEWVLERRLFEELSLVDATLFDHDGRLWLFAGGVHEGGSSWDELFAWHAPALAGPWTAHRLNPIKSDCRGARPGGRPIMVGGRLIRPAQRCERRYGESLVWLEVTELTPDSFSETEVAQWRAEDPRISGLHSADLGTDLNAIDFRTGL